MFLSIFCQESYGYFVFGYRSSGAALSGIGTDSGVLCLNYGSQDKKRGGATAPPTDFLLCCLNGTPGRA